MGWENQGFITFAHGKHILEGAFEMSEAEVSNLFNKIDKNNAGKIHYDQFAAFVKENPEYAKLFLTYERLKEEEEIGLSSSSPREAEEQNGAAEVSRSDVAATEEEKKKA